MKFYLDTLSTKDMLYSNINWTRQRAPYTCSPLNRIINGLRNVATNSPQQLQLWYFKAKQRKRYIPWRVKCTGGPNSFPAVSLRSQFFQNAHHGPNSFSSCSSEVLISSDQHWLACIAHWPLTRRQRASGGSFIAAGRCNFCIWPLIIPYLLIPQSLDLLLLPRHYREPCLSPKAPLWRSSMQTRHIRQLQRPL